MDTTGYKTMSDRIIKTLDTSKGRTINMDPVPVPLRGKVSSTGASEVLVYESGYRTLADGERIKVTVQVLRVFPKE